MEPKIKDWEKTKSILSAVHRNREEAVLGPQWQSRVMDAVRTLPRKEAMEDRPSVMLERMVWRFAPAACVLIAAMTLVLLSQDFTPQYGLVEAMMDDSMGNLLVRTIQMQ